MLGLVAFRSGLMNGVEYGYYCSRIDLRRRVLTLWARIPNTGGVDWTAETKTLFKEWFPSRVDETT